MMRIIHEGSPKVNNQEILFLNALALGRSSCFALVLVDWYSEEKSHNNVSVCFEFTFYSCTLYKMI